MSRPAFSPLASSVLCAAILTGPGACARIDTPETVARPLHIDLSAPVAEQVDLAWPQRNGVLVAEHSVQQPRQVTMRLPDGRQFTVPARRVAFRQQDGVLASVNIEPSGAAGEQAQALDHVRTLLDDNRMLDPTLDHALSGWALAGDPDRTARVVVRDVDVEVALRQDHRLGWQPTLDFEPRSCVAPTGPDDGAAACVQGPPSDTAVADVRS